MVLSSMTGFGKAVLDTPFGKLIIESQSVNRRYLEVFISLPKELIRFEHIVRKQVHEMLTRGQVMIRVYLIPNSNGVESFLPDMEFLKELKRAWKRIAKDLGSDPKKINLDFIMRYLPILPKQEILEDDSSHLVKCLKSALLALKEMKKMEGRLLSKDLSERIKLLEKMVTEIKRGSLRASKKMREKLLRKMEEALGSDKDVEDRVIREIAIFAERVDITEEIIRFKSHLTQFKTFLKGEIVGRKMDFLIQEMGREVNTIASKSMEAKISHVVVNMKSELEKMREQIQNIE